MTSTGPWTVPCAGTGRVRSRCGGLAFAGDELGVADERGDGAIDGPVVEFFRRGSLDDAAVPHHGDAVGQAERFFLIVRHEQRGRACFGQDLPHLRPHRRPQSASRLEKGSIEKITAGFGDQRPRQRHPLLLAAGEFGRIRLARCPPDRPSPAPPRRGAPGRAVATEARRCRRRRGGERARNPGRPCPMRRLPAARPRPPRRPPERRPDPPTRPCRPLVLETGYEAQRRRLAAAAGAEQRQQIPLRWPLRSRPSTTTSEPKRSPNRRSGGRVVFPRAACRR